MAVGTREIYPLSDEEQKIVEELGKQTDLIRLQAIAVMSHKLGEYIGRDAVTDILLNIKDHYDELMHDLRKKLAELQMNLNLEEEDE